MWLFFENIGFRHVHEAKGLTSGFVVNPDLVTRLSQGLPLNAVQQATVYGGGAAGYTDYPRWSGAALAG